MLDLQGDVVDREAVVEQLLEALTLVVAVGVLARPPRAPRAPGSPR